MIPFIGFGPDLDPVTPGVMTECSNIIPFEAGYKGAPTPVQLSVAQLAAACRGAASVTNLSSTVRSFAGTAAAIYELSGSTWSDVKSSAYTLGSEDRWSFIQYGNSTLAVTPTEVIQRSTGAAFADVASSPQAKIIEASQGFAIVFNTSTSSDEWYCSAYLDETNWTLSVSDQCVKGRLIGSPGPINAARRFGDDVIAYKARSMYVGSYVGAPEVWRWKQVSTDVGCVGQEAVVDTPIGHVFVGEDNIYHFDGTTPIPLATGVLRKWLYEDMSPLYRYKSMCLWDRQNQLVWIYYPSSGSTGAVDRCVVYHILKKQWGVAHSTIEAALAYSSGTFTYDTGPTVTYDGGLEIPYDAGYWISGRVTPAVINGSHYICTLSGATESSYFVTGDMGDEDFYRDCLGVKVRYTSKPTTSSATGYYKDEAGTTLTTGPSGDKADGKYDLRQAGRWHRFRIDTTGDFQMTGIRPSFVAAGRR